MAKAKDAETSPVTYLRTNTVEVGLAPDYPMVAPNYAERRSDSAKNRTGAKHRTPVRSG